MSSHLLIKILGNLVKFFLFFFCIDKIFLKDNLNETNRKRLLECKERLKNLNIEIKSMKIMLEKSSSSWQKFTESYNILNNWLENQKNISDISNVNLIKKHNR